MGPPGWVGGLIGAGIGLGIMVGVTVISTIVGYYAGTEAGIIANAVISITLACVSLGTGIGMIGSNTPQAITTITSSALAIGSSSASLAGNQEVAEDLGYASLALSVLGAADKLLDKHNYYGGKFFHDDAPRSPGDPVPLHRADWDPNKDIKDAEAHPADLEWFYKQVKDGGPWDYKHFNPKYDDFGVWDYGATGSAMKVSENFLDRFAGKLAIDNGHGIPDGDAAMISVVGKRAVPNPFSTGTYPYNYQPYKLDLIHEGIMYFNSHK